MTVNSTGDITRQLKSKPAIILYLLFAIIYIGIQGQTEGDFQIYNAASKDLFHSKDIYFIHYFDGYRYYYSTLFAILIYPLTFLPFVAAKYIWMVFNGVLLWRVIVIIGRYFDLALLPVRRQWLFVIFSCAFSANFALGNIYFEQITIVILLLSLKGLEYIFDGKGLLGAVLIALGMNIKLLPVVLLPYLLYRKQFAASVYTMAAYLFMLYLPALVIGMQQNNYLIKSWWSLVNPTNTDHILDVHENGFVSLTSLLSSLLVNVPPDKHELPIRRNIADISLTQLTWVINGVRLAFIAFTFYFLRTRPFFSKISKAHRYWEMSYIFLIIPLIFPHQKSYSFIFILPAIWGIFYYFFTNYDTMSRRKVMWMIIALTFTFLTTNANILLGEFNNYYDRFKIITYGILAMVPLLAVAMPNLKTEDKVG